VTMNARLPSLGVGPLKLEPKAEGPGRYVVSDASLTPSGEWVLELTDRVSAFDEFAAKVEVPIG